MVRKAAAKALGKLLSKEPSADEAIIKALREAANDPDEQVRWKAQKALRRLGAYAG
jgi:HEAT repeat protein